MIGRIVLCLVLVCGATTASARISATCDFYKVNTSLLSVSRDANSELYKDALYDGDIVCVSDHHTVNGSEWAYISHRLEPGNGQTPVEGWSLQRYLQKVSAADAQSLVAAAPPRAGAASPAPSAAPAPDRAEAAIRPEERLRFNQPIPFGAFPVNGHSIQEMLDTVPLFPPIEGLDDSLWQKKCPECHKWNRPRLCEQAKTYVKTPKNVLRVPHPFGGALKMALMRWAKSGCE